MTVTVCFPVDQVVQFDAMATVDTTVWSCRICGQEATARQHRRRPATPLRTWAVTRRRGELRTELTARNTP